MPSAPVTAASPLREPLLAFLGATALASLLFWTARLVPLVQQNLHAAIAFIFLYAPVLARRISGHDFSYREAGLRTDPLRLNAGVLGISLLLTWPLFFVAFYGFYGGLCRSGVPDWMLGFAEAFAPICHRWLGFGAARLVLPAELHWLLLTQIVVVALPEELFFRGYLFDRLLIRFPDTRSVSFLGAPLGRAWLLSSVLFGVGHVLVDFDPGRLAVIVPGLVFGWMRARTGSIVPGLLFHALCNLFSETLHNSFFS